MAYPSMYNLIKLDKLLVKWMNKKFKDLALDSEFHKNYIALQDRSIEFINIYLV